MFCCKDLRGFAAKPYLSKQKRLVLRKYVVINWLVSLFLLWSSYCCCRCRFIWRCLLLTFWMKAYCSRFWDWTFCSYLWRHWACSAFALAFPFAVGGLLVVPWHHAFGRFWDFWCALQWLHSPLLRFIQHGVSCWLCREVPLLYFCILFLRVFFPSPYPFNSELIVARVFAAPAS